MMTGLSWSARLLPPLLLTALCGCAPNLPASPTEKPLAEFETSKSFTADAADWPVDSWWEAYHDPQLTQLIDEALRNSPSLAIAAARVTQAKGLALEQGAAASPTLSGDGLVNGLHLNKTNLIPLPAGYQPVGEGALNFSYELDFWGRNAALIARATSQETLAEVQEKQSRLMLTTSIASLYADLTMLYGDRDAAENALHVRTESLDLVQNRFTLGLEARAAARQAEASTDTARAQLAELDESIALTNAKLAVLLGAGPDRGLQIHRPAIGVIKPLGLPQTLGVDLIGRRPDIIAARLTAEAAMSSVKAAKAAYYPNVNLAASFTALTLGFNLVSSAVPQIGRVGPAIHLPIFDGGTLDGTYVNARGSYDEAVATYNQTVGQALSDIASVVISTRALDARLAATRQAETAAAEAHDLAVTRYKGGLGTYLNVLTAEDALISSQRALADLQTRGFSLDITLVRALGGGFTAA